MSTFQAPGGWHAEGFINFWQVPYGVTCKRLDGFSMTETTKKETRGLDLSVLTTGLVGSVGLV